MKRIIQLLCAFGISLPYIAEVKAVTLITTLLSSPAATEAPQPSLFVQRAAKVASSTEITVLLSSGVLVAIALLIYVLYRNNVLTKKFRKLKKDLYGEPAKLKS